MKNTIELAAERHLKRLKFEPYIIEYNLKEN